MDDPHPRVTEPIRVFVLDDHEIVRRGVIDLLTASADIVVVGEAGTENEALQRIPTALPDVAIMGARLHRCANPNRSALRSALNEAASASVGRSGPGSPTSTASF